MRQRLVDLSSPCATWELSLYLHGCGIIWVIATARIGPIKHPMKLIAYSLGPPKMMRGVTLMHHDLFKLAELATEFHLARHECPANP